jgi:predicted glycoside hydrolase/deacetylase ChbG (UPF0249 family)
VFESGRLNERRLLRIVEALEPGDHELVTHPGMDPGVVPQEPGWRYGWERELTAVTSGRVRQALDAKGVTLCTYADLAN